MADSETTSVFEARYLPGLGTRYTVTSAVISIVIVVVGVFSTVVAYLSNPVWWVIALCVVIFGFVLLLALPSAFGSAAKWGADDRLALRVDAAGVTLARVGLLTWGEIAAIRIMDSGGVHGNVGRRGFEALTGTATHRFVTVYVTDGDAVIARTDRRAQAARNLHALEGNVGFDGVWGQGLDPQTWGEASRILAVEGARRSIPVHGRNDAGK